jgi:DNA-binding HxlR family transcriptional regulator
MIGPPELGSTVSNLMQDENSKSVFEQIINSKKIRYRILQKKLNIDEKSLDEALAKLEKADLIGAIGSGQKEFQTFYPLAAGFSANRLMNELKYK